MDDSARRLAQLAGILSDARPYGDASAPDPVEHLDQVRLQRIQRLTIQLHAHEARDPDGVDAVAMRLLLDEYAGVIAQLRGAARDTARTLEGLAAGLRTDRRLLDRQLEEQQKRLASTAPSDQRPASRNPNT